VHIFRLCNLTTKQESDLHRRGRENFVEKFESGDRDVRCGIQYGYSVRE
jgi:hypothetical protein